MVKYCRYQRDINVQKEFNELNRLFTLVGKWNESESYGHYYYSNITAIISPVHQLPELGIILR